MADPNALFTNMTVTFNTENDDKDNNTRLEIWINKAGEKEAAYRDIGRNDPFPNGSTKTFDIPPKTNSMKWSEIPGSWVQLRIDPVGDDSWRFKMNCVLRFSDGSTLVKDYGPSTLDQDSRQGNFQL